MAVLTWYVAIVEHPKDGNEKSLAKRVKAIEGQIIAMGFPAWVPLEIRYHRNSRKKARSRIWDAPCLPGIVFAGVPVALHGDLQTLRYPCSLMRDVDGYALPVADLALQAFRAELDRINSHNRRCYNRLMQDRKPGKRKWVKVSIDNLADVLADFSRLEIL